ncbi:DUF6338 family protein [Micromonospora sp. DH14]|uniref:DUF6338 family protein n=1 Tax=Micromonospora sp. DH14 TaxID=3040120 RepID=UPI00244102BD|nr:DUF6338 family protein [Micromonospora sp. DH14]MDG9677919.1 DUF6338 family protein [Micromonospora sp. DH14]
MPTTFLALAVAIMAILPGAACTFAYGARVGSYGVSLPDRVTRFLAVSIIFQALLSGLTYKLYVELVATGRLERGEVSPWAIELTAVCYVAIPYLAGWLVGEGITKDWLRLRSLVRGSPEPRAWDFLFSHRRPTAILRIKLKSGQYIAGAFGTSADGKRSHASGYPEAGDLYLSQTVAVDDTTGEFLRNDDQELIFGPGGMLIRWDEVIFLEVFE